MVDTNVLVSALIQRSYPYFIVDQVLVDTNITLCISKPLFSEYVEVLNRAKFSRFKDFHSNAQLLLTEIETIAEIFTPSVLLNIISDKGDNKLLELAETCIADYLITGNTNDFTMHEYKVTRIMSPKDFFEVLNK